MTFLEFAYNRIVFFNNRYGCTTCHEISLFFPQFVGFFVLLLSKIPANGIFIVFLQKFYIFHYFFMNKKLTLAIIILAFLGIINAAYLSWEAYNIVFAAKSGLLGTSICDINETFSCTSFMNNPRSRIFGIPFPMIALVVYPILFGLSLFAHFKNNLTAIKIITIMAFGGLAFNGYVISQEFIAKVFCPLCLMCTGYILTIAILGSIIWKKSSQKTLK